MGRELREWLQFYGGTPQGLDFCKLAFIILESGFSGHLPSLSHDFFLLVVIILKSGFISLGVYEFCGWIHFIKLSLFWYQSLWSSRTRTSCQRLLEKARADVMLRNFEAGFISSSCVLIGTALQELGVRAEGW